MIRQHLAILADNKPGVLTHVAGLISRRAINIEFINAGYTEERDVTRINIVVSVEDRYELDQAIKQLAKLIDVIKVVNLDDAPFVSYELAMIKVSAPTPQVREELTNLAELFHAKVVDVQKKSPSAPAHRPGRPHRRPAGSPGGLRNHRNRPDRADFPGTGTGAGEENVVKKGVVARATTPSS